MMDIENFSAGLDSKKKHNRFTIHKLFTKDKTFLKSINTTKYKLYIIYSYCV